MKIIIILVNLILLLILCCSKLVDSPYYAIDSKEFVQATYEISKDYLDRFVKGQCYVYDNPSMPYNIVVQEFYYEEEIDCWWKTNDSIPYDGICYQPFEGYYIGVFPDSSIQVITEYLWAKVDDGRTQSILRLFIHFSLVYKGGDPNQFSNWIPQENPSDIILYWNLCK